MWTRAGAGAGVGAISGTARAEHFAWSRCWSPLDGAGSGVGAGAVLEFLESKHFVRAGNAGAERFYPESKLEPESSGH